MSTVLECYSGAAGVLDGFRKNVVRSMTKLVCDVVSLQLTCISRNAKLFVPISCGVPLYMRHWLPSVGVLSSTTKFPPVGSTPVDE